MGASVRGWVSGDGTSAPVAHSKAALRNAAPRLRVPRRHVGGALHWAPSPPAYRAAVPSSPTRCCGQGCSQGWLAVGGGWRLDVGGGWRGWRLAVDGWWGLAVGGWLSLGAVLQGGPPPKKNWGSEGQPCQSEGLSGSKPEPDGTVHRVREYGCGVTAAGTEMTGAGTKPMRLTLGRQPTASTAATNDRQQ